ncbi:MAG: SDR family NAD(P)-dependent oxidoreductase [Candidatus Hydrogenedentes bacterium]|nr:SDR family NAD(P)-dependent oxidoreductase [Candidatus Hydrogenedentota bacterium]
MSTRNFHGKRILITGGSSGIGLEMARILAKEGAQLALVARGQERLDAAQEQLTAHGGQVLVYSCDVQDGPAVLEVAARAAEALGGLDGVIANSGYCHPGCFEDLSLEDVDRQLDTNLKGVIYALRGALPHMKASTDPFMAITSSPAGTASIYGFTYYGATKAALNIMSHALRQEYVRKGVSVHLLLPPDTDTPGYKEEVPLYPPTTRKILSGGTLATAEQVAPVFVEAIRCRKHAVTYGVQTKVMFKVLHHAPWFWEQYCKWCYTPG